MDSNKDKTNHSRVAKRGTMTDNTQISFKNIKDLAPSGILDFQFFQKAEKEGKIDVKYNEINKIFTNIENSKKYQHSTQEYQPYHYNEKHDAKIKLADLKNRISLLNPSYPVNDLNTLFKGNNEVTAQEMYDLLKDNELLEDFDPMQEALNLFTSHNGEIDIEKVSSLMHQLGYGELDKKDKEILKECLDVDRDNKISEKDFKEIANYINSRKYLH